MKFYIFTSLFLMVSSIYAGSIATIDMNETFNKYHKTIRAEKQMREQLSIIETSAAELKQRYETEVAKYKKLINDSTDIGIDKAKRQALKDEAELKRGEILRMEDFLKDFNSDSRKRLEKMHDLARKEVLLEIAEVVKTLAQQKNYDIVIDHSGKTSLLIPAVTVAGEKTDITKEVLAILNKGNEAFVSEWLNSKIKKDK